MPSYRQMPRRTVRRAPTRWKPRGTGVKRFVRRALIIALLVTTGTVASINLAVGFFGRTVVSPLSPFFLREKVHALGRYALHRVGCIFRDDHSNLPEIVQEVARARGLDPWLLAALVHVESNGIAHRISWTGAMGPAQLMPATAALLDVDDPFDPREGIDGGARYLSQMLRRFDGEVPLALAAYTGGPGVVVGRRVPEHPEVSGYVTKVLTRWQQLRPRVSPPVHTPVRNNSPAVDAPAPRAGHAAPRQGGRP